MGQDLASSKSSRLGVCRDINFQQEHYCRNSGSLKHLAANV